MPTGGFRLFRVFGVDVFLHWSWFLVAAYEIRQRQNTYSTPAWMVAEYLTLFAIVLLHEFGHAFACRSVGGTANRIVLWPLGGLAYVDPPPRPGAVLWSIVAGPLVNLVLVPVTFIAYVIALRAGLRTDFPDLCTYLKTIAWLNVALLVFNVLPIYPLDGGKILHALLWFVLGRGRSLAVASFIGVLGALGFAALAFASADLWLGVIAFFFITQSLIGFQQAKALRRLAKAPRHDSLACPSCDASPLRGPYWSCDQCGTAFDTFEHRAVCPNCFARFRTTKCPNCHNVHPIDAWIATAEPAEPLDVHPA
jgi:Zn-dependent protease